jgi:hypothetical protein
VPKHFLVEAVRVATRYVVFYTETGEHVCVPQPEVTKVRIGPRVKPRRQPPTGFSADFSVERIDKPES